MVMERRRCRNRSSEGCTSWNRFRAWWLSERSGRQIFVVQLHKSNGQKKRDSFFIAFYCLSGKDIQSSKLMTTVPPVLIQFLQLGVQRPLVVGPVGEDVAHGAAGFVETQVETTGVNLRTICDFKDWFETDAFLSCKQRGYKTDRVIN